MPLQRARHTWKHLRPFDPQKQEKLAYGIYLQQQKPRIPPLTGTLRLDAFFYFKIPFSHSKKTEHDKYHSFKPDGSNLIKWLEDVAVDVGILRDDSIIAITYYEKLWTYEEARTIFTLTEL
jgi:Holliday junction resolvase RusA-like endonuclease